MKNINLDLSEKETIKEKEYLKHSLAEISEDIFKNTAKKHSITSDIIDYRKYQIEESRDDSDLQVDYFDHERFVQEETFKAIIKRLVELTELYETPYFGKVGFYEDSSYNEIYVGKYGLIDEKNYEPLIIDWRAPIASLFYKGSVGKAHYNAPVGKMNVDINLRRQFIIKNSELKGFFDSEIDIKDDILLQVLSSNAGKKLKDIIMTIQEEQDSIIREPREGAVIVNGVAGSGKTTIALHRIAYLLYNHRDILEGRVLILGPNNMFMDFISEVLPSLGESGVKDNTFKDFAMELLEFEGEMLQGEDFLESSINGEEDLISDIKYKRSKKFVQDIDNYLDKLEKTYFEFKDIYFEDKIIMTKKEMEKYLLEDFIYLPFFRRATRLKKLIINRLRRERDKERYIIDKKYNKLQKEFEEMSGPGISGEIETERREEIRALVKRVSQSRSQFSDYSKGHYLLPYFEFIEFNFITENDIAPMLYFKNRLNGVDFKAEIRHIVLDEAQEYSYLHYKLLKEITSCTSFTIVGDTNQMIVKGESPMMDLDEIFNKTRYFNLATSYRSTYEIMEYANKFVDEKKIVPLVRHGEDVKEIHTLNYIEAVDKAASLVENYKNDDIDTIGILTRDMKKAKIIHNMLKDKINIKLIDSEDDLLKGGLYIMPSYFSKGLEFDGVIIIEEEDEFHGKDLLKYIMSTRALHKLAVVSVSESLVL